MKKSLCLFVLVLISSIAWGQRKVVSGKVTNQATGEPLIGVNILANKQKGGATTKEDGSYSIMIDKNSTVLIFSYVGFATQTISIGDKSTIDVALVVSATANDEVVIIGYGTQKKSHLTGAISKFKNERLDESPVSRLDQALQGKIAGVQVQNLSSEAGAEPKVRIRGINSINASANPLVVIDGVILPNGPEALGMINMADVESVEVLKDAASAAIYGSRAANGVVMITTKSGKSNKTKYNVKFSTGAKIAYEMYPMMTTTEYSNLLFYEASLKAKDPSIPVPTGTAIISNNERAAYVIENTLMGGKGTDWQKQALRNATVRNLQMNITGGNNTAKYFISGGYQKDDGMMFHSTYDKLNLRTKVDLQLSKRVKFSVNLNPSYIRRERPSVNYIDFVRFQSFLPVYHTPATAAFVSQAAQWANVKPGDFVQARHFNGRVYSGIMPDGSLWTTTSATDPFNTANNTPKSIMETRTITANDYRLLSSAELTINIIPGLDFKSLASAYAAMSNALDFAKRNSSKDGDINRGQYNDRLTTDLLSENTMTYTKQIKDHSINVLAGFTAQKTRVKDEQTVGLDYPSDNITTLNTALQIDKAGSFNTKTTTGLLSYLGRVIYSFKNKYLLTASIRSDGSSKFGPGHKWGTFPAASVGWVVSQESFMKNVSWLNNLKLRGSYGLIGNNNIPDNAWIDLLYIANYPFGSGTGTASAGQSASDPNAVLANPNITWERTFSFNGGLDLTLLKNAINLTVDVYQSKTEALLLKQPTLGFTGAQFAWNNIGKLQNDGIEIELTTNNIRKRFFRWSTSFNLSHNKNKLLNFGNDAFALNQGERTELYMNRVGDPFVQFFGYKTEGVWLSQTQIDKERAAGLTSNLSNLFVPGGLKLVDVNGDKVIDEKDRIVTGSPYPDFTWGITNNITYRDFDLSFMFQGINGAQLVNGDPNYNESKRYNKSYNSNRWLSPMFPGDGKTPYSTVGFNWMLTDYVIEDASYFTLREVIVGYTLPDKVAKSIHMNSLRVYFSGQNLYFGFGKGYRGINPEARFLTGPYAVPQVEGYQRGSYPIPKTILFGVDVNF